MNIVKLEKYMIEEVVNIWNTEVSASGIYKPFTTKSFQETFINNNSYNKEGSLVIKLNNEIIGYGNAVFKDKNETTPGFITCVVIKKAYQRKGYGTILLKELENFLKANNKNYIRQLFLNPISLEWIIPNTNNHDHPNAPAVEYNSAFYLFLLANGYNVSGQQQDAFYLNITNYEIPDKIKQINNKNESNGYYITFYEKEKHHGFKELFEALNNPLWYEAVKNNLKLDKPHKMLVVVKNNKILGWTGPLFTTNSKRGYFAGIGIHPNIQGLGIGSSLFSELIYQSKINGSQFMSLFTGSENPARNIYLKAGFKIVKSFAVLRKEI
ncbi:MAG TPA: GNAT family N-acetyltransferase [Acholeplasma sp.]|nr:GNAT family N-acetyltransferase [Acholeplasma sp.]